MPKLTKALIEPLSTASYIYLNIDEIDLAEASVEEFAALLMEAFKKNNNEKSILLSSINVEEISIFTQVMNDPSCHLKHLALCQMSKEATIEITKAILNPHFTLNELILSRMDRAATAEIAKVLTSPHAKVERLTLQEMSKASILEIASRIFDLNETQLKQFKLFKLSNDACRSFFNLFRERPAFRYEFICIGLPDRWIKAFRSIDSRYAPRQPLMNTPTVVPPPTVKLFIECAKSAASRLITFTFCQCGSDKRGGV